MKWPWRRERSEEPVRESAPPDEPPPSLERGRDAWWFAPAGSAPFPGTRETAPVLPAPGEAGLHATARALDALEFARGPHLCRVRLTGEIVARGPILAATERTVLWTIDPLPLLRSILVEILRPVLGTDVPPELELVAKRPLTSAELASITARAERAREDALDADARVADAEWRIEQRKTDDATALARTARTEAARSRARAHALDALRVASGRAPSELSAAIDVALRAQAWSDLAATTFSATALDESLARARARWSEILDERLVAYARTTGATRARPPRDRPQTEPPHVASTPTPTSIAPLTIDLPRLRSFRPAAPAALARDREWRAQLRTELSRERACRRAAIVEVPATPDEPMTLVVIAIAAPFDQAESIARVIQSVDGPEGTPLPWIVTSSESLRDAGADVMTSAPVHRARAGWRAAIFDDAVRRAWAMTVLFDRDLSELDRDLVPAASLGPPHLIDALARAASGHGGINRVAEIGLPPECVRYRSTVHVLLAEVVSATMLKNAVEHLCALGSPTYGVECVAIVEGPPAERLAAHAVSWSDGLVGCIDDDKLALAIERAWRTETFWMLPHLAAPSERMGLVWRARCSGCRRELSFVYSRRNDPITCACGASLSAHPTKTFASVEIPYGRRCGRCRAGYLGFDTAPDEVCPECGMLRHVREPRSSQP